MNKSMGDSRTPMNFVQRMKKQMKKTNRHTRKKKRTETHITQEGWCGDERQATKNDKLYPKEKVGSLNKLSEHDPRIRTVLDR